MNGPFPMAMLNNQRVRKIVGSKDFTFETKTRDQRRHGFPDMAKPSMKAQDGPMPYTWQIFMGLAANLYLGGPEELDVLH